MKLHPGEPNTKGTGNSGVRTSVSSSPSLDYYSPSRVLKPTYLHLQFLEYYMYIVFASYECVSGLLFEKPRVEV